MLKISQLGGAGPELTLKLEGRAVGQWVGELKTLCEVHFRLGHSFILDLSDVTYADHSGVALLAKLQSRGVELKNCSALLDEQLKSPGNH